MLDNTFWLGTRSMRLRQNFTGFLVPFESEDEGTVYLGDLQEGRYEVLTTGARGSYTLGTEVNTRYQELSVGYSARRDSGRTELVRLRDRLDVPYLRDFDRTFDITNISGWVRGQSELTSWLILRGGVRLDTFQFNIRDLTLPEADTDGTRLTEQTIASGGAAINPRVSGVIRLAEDLRLSVAYGRGTRSTDAAALSESEEAPFATSEQVETGFKWHWHGEERVLTLQGSYVYAQVERDIIFDPGAGRNVLIGESWRHAVLFQGRLTEQERFDLLANVGWARAMTEERDPTSLDFGEEVLLPYLPQLIARLDGTYRHPFGVRVGRVPLALRVSANFTYVPGRPLPLGETGDPFALVGGSVELELWHTTLRLEGRNLLDQRYRQSEFNYPSRFDRTLPLPASGTPRSERHFVAGEPLFVMASVELALSKIFGFGEAPPPADSKSPPSTHGAE
ncbi:MAG: TonB-dependent receptor [Myxococcota bacterium]